MRTGAEDDEFVRLDKKEAAAMSRLFSAAVLRDFGKCSRSPLFTRLLNQTRLGDAMPRSSSVGAVLDEAFKTLSRSNLRDDYVYRSAITEKVLLGRHSLKTATLLNEVRTGSCKADVVILNGTSTAYEIKSERDSLARLQNQLTSYRHVFATVNVVVSESHYREALAIAPADVGIITLSKRFTFHTVRTPQDSPDRVIPTMLLDLLRVDEATRVLEGLGYEVPFVPNTQIRSHLSRLFDKLDPASAHKATIEELRTRRSQMELSSFIKTIPISIRAASLAARPNLASQNGIQDAIETSLTDALAWK